MLHNPMHRPRRAQRGRAVRHAHHIAAHARIRPQPRVIGHIQRHEFHPQQEVVVGRVAIRRVGDGREREGDRPPGAVRIHRRGRRWIRIRHHHIGFHKLRSARRDFKLISLARIRQRGVRVGAHEVNAYRHRIRQHEVRHHTLRHVHADLVNKPLADRPVIAGCIIMGVLLA